MDSAAHDLWTLVRLRALLARRIGLKAGPSRRRVGARLVWTIVGIAVLVQLSLLTVGLLVTSLGPVLATPAGRLLLGGVLTRLSTWAILLLFFFAAPAVLALFTYNSDLKLLLLTPVRPWVVLAEKFAALYGVLAAPALAFGVPIVLGIGRVAGLSGVFDLWGVVVLLLLPVGPLALAMLLTVAVLRWVPPARARAVTAVLGAVVSGGVYIGSQLLATGSGLHAGHLPSLLAGGRSAWWSTLPLSWPGRILAAVATGDVGAAAVYLVATSLLVALLTAFAVTLSARLFATGWATYQEVGRRARPAPMAPAATKRARGMEVSPFDEARPRSMPVNPSPVAASPLPLPRAAADLAADAAKAGIPRLVWWPLVGKEWRVLRRDPQVWARLLYSLVIAGFGLYRSVVIGTSVRATPFGVGGSQDGAGTLFGLLTFVTYLLLASLALPAVNREGRSLPLLALAPLSARDILLAKWTFCAASALVPVEAILVVGAVALRLPVATALLGACVLAGVAVALSGVLILVSLLWPRLDWDNPRKQVSLPASLIGGFGGLVLMVGIVLLLFLALALAPDRPLLAVASGAGLFALLGLISAAVALYAPRRLAALLTGS